MDTLQFIILLIVVFAAVVTGIILIVRILAHKAIAWAAEEGISMVATHGPPLAGKATSAIWRKFYSKLPGWAQRVLPTPKASTPRRSGPQSQGGNPVTANANPPAGAGQQPAAQPTLQNDGWPNWMSALAPIIMAILAFAALLVANLTPLYYTGAHPQLPNVWVLMQGIIATLVGVIVWLVGRLRSLQLDLIYIYELHPQLKRPNDWAPQPQPQQAPAANPNP